MKSTTPFVLPFANITLPIVLNDEGFEVVPLKLISDVLGLNWNSQKEVISKGFKVDLLGTCHTDFHIAGQVRKVVAIRLDSVIIWMSAINPNSVRSAGNDAAADYLLEKIIEWRDVLHHHELGDGTFGKERQMIEKNRRDDLNYFMKLDKARHAAKHPGMQKVYDTLLKQQAAALGITYEPESI